MFPVADPTWIFLIVLGIILFAPMLLEKLRIPSIVGLIFAGVLIGPYGFHVLERDASFSMFGEVGLYYIMFLAALEMNLQDVGRSRWHALGFGLLSFAFPVALGFAANVWVLGTATVTAVLMSAMYASHTLVSYPIVLRYGQASRRSVTLAVGGTIVADTLTLLMLALVVGSLSQDTGGIFWLWLVLKVVGAGATIVFFFPRLSRWFFRRINDGVVQYIFVLGLVFLGAGLMKLVGMEGILGAFLVGLVLNKQIPATSPLMNHVEFIGNALFIPYFLIGVGMFINLRAFQDVHALGVAGVMIVVSVASKWLAAFAAQHIFRLTPDDRLLMFGLTGSRAAATLAIVLVGYSIVMPDGLTVFGEDVLNGTMLLILASCVISSFATESASRRLAATSSQLPSAAPTGDRLLIAIGRPDNVEPLVNLALLLRTPKSPLPLNAINVVLESDEESRHQGLKELERAARLAAAAQVRMLTHSRWSVNVVSGLTHAMKELDSSDLLVGLHHKQRLSEPFFGQLSTNLIAAVDRQIIVYREVIPINTVRRLHLVVPKKAEYEPAFSAWADRIALLARQLSVVVEVYSGQITMQALRQYWAEHHRGVEVAGHVLQNWSDLLGVAQAVRPDHLVGFVMARQGTLSHHRYMNALPAQFERYFSARNLLVVFPAQYRGTIGKTSVLITK